MKQLMRVAVAAGLLMIAAPVPASAAGAAVTFSPGSADPEYATSLQVKGTGFQSVPKGYGGIYLLFGWVADGAWRPSQGGAAGETYRYVKDKETKDNNGFQRFLAFPGSDTASAANGELAANGTWSATLVIPGARFKAADRAGKIVDVDCLKVRCGLITVGAHGVVNANNETFTPVTFAVPKAPATQAAPPPPPPASPAPPLSSSAAPASSSAPPMSTVESTPAAAAPAPAVQPAAQSGESGSWWWIAVVAGVVLIAALAVPLIRARKRTRNAEGE
ncbi:hypothetical protein GCM10027598_29560 [Amycolatopsis oliviviridis]|uniref:Uncharacterized protein n=1 Tax=Amycolatopsis oliviviridis TaxID=1471590 RepID=A0ABQ3MJH3_9PSEU|nr:hypothetical protein [Amycolatopsis oliviviridis]GHH37007.1 hypothetical protein GCM10017790_80720 [Amycolatopsis oliviviridis]